MNAGAILADEETMTLEEKLAAIDKAMQQETIEFNKKNGRDVSMPVDPALLTICDGCE